LNELVFAYLCFPYHLADGNIMNSSKLTGRRISLSRTTPGFNPEKASPRRVRGFNICYRSPVFRPSKKFGFDFHIFIWADDFYR